jgi:hypothetical protein
MQCHAFYVHETDHGAGAAAHFDETRLDPVGVVRLRYRRRGRSADRQQPGQVSSQGSLQCERGVAGGRRGRAERENSGFGQDSALGQRAGPRPGLGFLIMALACPLRQVAEAPFQLRRNVGNGRLSGSLRHRVQVSFSERPLACQAKSACTFSALTPSRLRHHAALFSWTCRRVPI